MGADFQVAGQESSKQPSPFETPGCNLDMSKYPTTGMVRKLPRPNAR
jgi:hypothetical protein